MASPIIICGAGLSGLLLAQGLRKHGIPFRIFERDHNLHARTQGYRVRVSGPGIQALKDNLTLEHFELFQKVCCAQGVAPTNVPSTVLDALTGIPGGSLVGPGQQTPFTGQQAVLSVDRSSAREVLSRNLGDCLEFSKEFVRFEENDSGVVVHFSDGSVAVGAALVAADGALSKVRRQTCPHYQLADTEARLLFGKVELSPEVEKLMSGEIISGLKMIQSPTQRCLLEVMRFEQSMQGAPSDYIYWVMFLPRDRRPNDDELFSSNPDQTLQLAQRLTQDWKSGFRCLFDARFAKAAPYQILTSRPSALPASEKSNSPRVVLMGDSGHVMPPTAALGATTAITDASVLLKCLIEYQEAGVQEAFRQYEATMVEYAKGAVEKSAILGKVVLGMKPFDEMPAVVRH